MYRYGIASFLGVAATTLVANVHAIDTPCVSVPSCSTTHVASVSYSKALPNMTKFPLTQVDLCYTDESMEFTLTAYNETSFFYNASQGTNDYIFLYEVLELFISRGVEDPVTYLEFDINPSNVTLQTIVYNPSRRRTPGTPFDHFLVGDPLTDGIHATTKLDRPGQTWESKVTLPLGLFNVDKGKAKGTTWRMNFFRTVTSPEIFPAQILGAWSPPNVADFHVTPYFGHFNFV